MAGRISALTLAAAKRITLFHAEARAARATRLLSTGNTAEREG